MTPDLCSGFTAPSSPFKAPAPFGVLVECFGGPWDGSLFWARGNRVIRQGDGVYELVRMRDGVTVTWGFHWLP